MPVQPSFREGLLTVTDKINRDIAIVRTGTPILDVALLMEQSPFRHVLVEDGHLSIVGIVSQDDLTRHTARIAREDWQARPIEDLMSTRLANTSAEESELTTESTEISSESTVSCVPIVEQGQVVGVMTADDVLLSWNHLEPALRAAGTDDVTKLANRTMFMRRLSEEWDRSLRSREPLALILFDIDYFKQVNDQCGHMSGDQVLAGVGACIKDSLRSYDVVARIGGDEFAALCFNCDVDSSEILLGRIRESVHSLPAPQQLARDRLTLSIGTVVVQSDFDNLTTDDLFLHADACLYQSKAAGRDRAFRVVFKDSDPATPERVGGVEYSEGSVDYIQHSRFSSNQTIDATHDKHTVSGFVSPRS